MFKYYWWILLFLLNSFDLITKSASSNIFQKLSVFETTKPRCNNCDTALQAEHFFKVLLSEFHQAPPACTCVQMCVNLPPYCYPEGCSKQMNIDDPKAVNIWNDTREKHVRQAQPYINDKKKYNTMGDSDAMKFEFDSATQKGPLKQRSWMSEIRPNTYIDRYRKVVKYRKMPKIELHYNKDGAYTNNHNRNKITLKYPKDAIEMNEIPSTPGTFEMKLTKKMRLAGQHEKVLYKNNENNYEYKSKALPMTLNHAVGIKKIILPTNKNNFITNLESTPMINNDINFGIDKKPSYRNALHGSSAFNDIGYIEGLKDIISRNANYNIATQGIFVPYRTAQPFNNINYMQELDQNYITDTNANTFDAYEINKLNKFKSSFNTDGFWKRVGFIEVPDLIAVDMARHYIA